MSVFRLTGPKILGRIGTHIFSLFFCTLKGEMLGLTIDLDSFIFSVDQNDVFDHKSFSDPGNLLNIYISILNSSRP